MTVPPLTFRLDKGSPLSSEEYDQNLRLLRDFCDGLAKLYEVVFNADGTLKNDSVGTAAIVDRAITQQKLHWLANFFCVASGVDNYTGTISPTADFTYGDGATTAFFLPVLFTNANTGAVTLDINSGGAKAVTKNGTDPLVGGDIAAGSVHLLVYDGTQFQMVSPPKPGAGHGIQVIGPGSGNWTVPVGIYVLEVECVGGGGGGGAYVNPWGGGGGGYVYKRMSVSPGDVIAYDVGAGGTASTGTGNSTDGDDTTFGTLTAGGGSNGDAGLGAGGSASGGDLNLPGQNGSQSGGISSATDKRTGGSSGRAMGYGGFFDLSASSNPTGYGGGGYGDSDAGGGPQTSDGADGVIIIKW